MESNKVLIIGMVWPEPTSSAAGTRMIQLIELFLSNGFEVFFASAASKSPYSFDLGPLNVKEFNIKLNDVGFNVQLKDLNPNIVLFDRFVTEEQYGWRVHQECPSAMRILDTEDLHFLRHARQHAVTSGKPAEYFSDMAKREIASVLRCDLSLIISETEMDILKQQFSVDPILLYYLPFLETEIQPDHTLAWTPFEEREGFVFIGNYLHEPNWHTLQVLKTKVWPALRKKLPGVALHLYGAYATQKVMQLNNDKEKFLIHGRAEDARAVIAQHRVLVAPIQFGAGVKGKFIDAMQVGTPTVTTSTGAEAMQGDLEWNGAITDNLQDFVKFAAELYQNKALWLNYQNNGIRIINERYGKQKYSQVFIETIEGLYKSINIHRQHNFIGQILLQQSINSIRYMSLWIEEKNKNLTYAGKV